MWMCVCVCVHVCVCVCVYVCVCVCVCVCVKENIYSNSAYNQNNISMLPVGCSRVTTFMSHYVWAVCVRTYMYVGWSVGQSRHKIKELINTPQTHCVFIHTGLRTTNNRKVLPNTQTI